MESKMREVAAIFNLRLGERFRVNRGGRKVNAVIREGGLYRLAKYDDEKDERDNELLISMLNGFSTVIEED